MTEIAELQEALLELGFEDLIPLPEAIADPGVLAETNGSESLAMVSHALVALLDFGLVQVWTGHWEAEPVLANCQQARALLLDPARYSYEGESDGQDRVYYVNVENYRA